MSQAAFDPHVPDLIHRANGVYDALGTHDAGDLNMSKLQIELHPNG